MATNPKSLAEAQAAYDNIQQQRDRILRNDYIAGQQAIKGISNYLKQNGYNGGASETAFLKTLGASSDVSDLDIKLADLAVLISRFKNQGRGGRTSIPTPTQKLIDLGVKGDSYRPTSPAKPLTAGNTANGPYKTNVRMTR